MPSSTTFEQVPVCKHLFQSFSNEAGKLFDVDITFLKLYKQCLELHNSRRKFEATKQLYEHVISNRKQFGSNLRSQWAILALTDIYLNYSANDKVMFSEALNCFKYIKDPLNTKIAILSEYGKALCYFMASAMGEDGQFATKTFIATGEDIDNAIKSFMHLKNCLEVAARIDWFSDGITACKLLLRLSCVWRTPLIAHDSSSILAGFRLAIDVAESAVNSGALSERDAVASKKLLCYLNYEASLAYEQVSMFGQARKHILSALDLTDPSSERFKNDRIIPVNYRIGKKLLPYSNQDTEIAAVFLIEQAAMATEKDLVEHILIKALAVLTPKYSADYSPIDLLEDSHVRDMFPSFDDPLKHRLIFECLVNCFVLCKRHSLTNMTLWISYIMVNVTWPESFPEKQEKLIEAHLIFLDIMFRLLKEKFEDVAYESLVDCLLRPLEFAKTLGEHRSIYIHKNLVRIINNFFGKQGKNLYSPNQWLALFAALFVPILPRDDVDSFQTFVTNYAILHVNVVKTAQQAMAEKAEREKGEQGDKPQKAEKVSTKDKPKQGKPQTGGKTFESKPIDAIKSVKLPDAKAVEALCLEAINATRLLSRPAIRLMFLLYEVQNLRSGVLNVIETAEYVFPVSQVVYFYRMGKDIIERQRPMLETASTKLLTIQPRTRDLALISHVFTEPLKFYRLEEQYLEHMIDAYELGTLDPDDRPAALLKIIFLSFNLAKDRSDAKFFDRAVAFIKKMGSQHVHLSKMLPLMHRMKDISAITAIQLRSCIIYLLSYFRVNKTAYRLTDFDADILISLLRRYLSVETQLDLDFDAIIQECGEIVPDKFYPDLAWIHIQWFSKAGKDAKTLESALHRLKNDPDTTAGIWYALTDKNLSTSHCKAAYAKCIEEASKNNPHLISYYISKNIFDIEHSFYIGSNKWYFDRAPVELDEKSTHSQRITVFCYHVMKCFDTVLDIGTRRKIAQDAIDVLSGLLSSLVGNVSAPLTDAKKAKIEAFRKVENVIELDSCLSLLIYTLIDFNTFSILVKSLEYAPVLWCKNSDLLCDAFSLLSCIMQIQGLSEKSNDYRKLADGLYTEILDGNLYKRLLPWISFKLYLDHAFFEETVEIHMKLRESKTMTCSRVAFESFNSIFTDVLTLSRGDGFAPKKILYTMAAFAGLYKFIPPSVCNTISMLVQVQPYSALWKVAKMSEQAAVLLESMTRNWNSFVERNLLLTIIPGLLRKILIILNCSKDLELVKQGVVIFYKLITMVREIMKNNSSKVSPPAEVRNTEPQQPQASNNNNNHGAHPAAPLTAPQLPPTDEPAKEGQVQLTGNESAETIEIVDDEMESKATYLEILDFKFRTICLNLRLMSADTESHMSIVDKYLKSLDSPSEFETIISSIRNNNQEFIDTLTSMIDNKNLIMTYRLELMKDLLQYHKINGNPELCKSLLQNGIKYLDSALYNGYYDLAEKISDSALLTESRDPGLFSYVLVLLFSTFIPLIEKRANRAIVVKNDLYLARRWGVSFDIRSKYLSYERAIKNVREVSVEWKKLHPKNLGELEGVIRTNANEFSFFFVFSLDAKSLYIASIVPKIVTQIVQPQAVAKEGKKEKGAASSNQTETVDVVRLTKSVNCFNAALKDLLAAQASAVDVKDHMMTVYMTPIQECIASIMESTKNAQSSQSPSSIVVYCDRRIPENIDFSQYLKIKVERKFI